MAKESDRTIDMDIADAIIERTVGFDIGANRYHLYPVTLGKYVLIQRMISCLNLNAENIKVNPYIEILRVVESNKCDICRILSFHTFPRREDVLDNKKINSRAKVFERKLSNEELAELFLITLPDNVEVFIGYMGLDSEMKERKRISEYKREKSFSVSFGGKSIYGTLIDYACQRYGWTMDYVVWGISYTNLRMLINDAITTIELTQEEAKDLGISKGGVISGDNPQNIDKIRNMLKD